MTNIAKYRQPKLFLKILVMFFRQKYEEYSSVTFIRKNKTARDLLLEIRDSTSFLNVLTCFNYIANIKIIQYRFRIYILLLENSDKKVTLHKHQEKKIYF